MLTLIIIALIAFLAWIIFKPDWLPKPPDNEVTRVVNKQAGQLKQSSNSWVQRTRHFWQKKTNLGLQFKTWITQDDLAQTAGLDQAFLEGLAELQLWAAKIPEAEAGQIAAELSDFCQGRGVELRWLLDDTCSADMRAALTHLTLFYCQAVRERSNIRPLAALRAWEETPQAKENPTFGRRLFVELVDSKLIDIPASILLSTEKERRQHMTDSIRAVLEKDRSAVVACAEKVILDLDAKPVGKADKAQNAPMPAPIPAAEEV
jgi:hypothetical protein